MSHARIVTFWPVLLSLLLLAGCTAQTEETASAADEAALNTVYDRFSRAYDELDVQAVVNLYTDDARYLPSSDEAPILRGRTAVEGAFGFLDRVKKEGGRMSIAFRIDDRAIEGNLAYDVGYYKTVSTPATGEARTSVGKFVTVLKKQADGSWRFQVDGYSGAPVEAFDK